MFNKILFPTDFSELSEKVLKYIVQLKESGTQEVLILHVVDKWIFENFSRSSLESLNEIIDKAIGVAKVSLETKKTHLENHGFKVEIRSVVGVPSQEILKAENDDSISVIVMGSHGLRNVPGVLLGSVSEKVIRKCQKPVLVIKR